MEIGLLIGSNCPRALEPLEVIPADGEGPFAVRYCHGWTLNGPVKAEYIMKYEQVPCNRIMFRDIEKVEECSHHKEITQMVDMDFNKDCEDVLDQTKWSQEDQKFIRIVEQHHNFQDDHHILPLPSRGSVTSNRDHAESRLHWHKKKMQRDEDYEQDYTEFIDKCTYKSNAHEVPENKARTDEHRVHHLLHHGVYHSKKKKRTGHEY